MRNIFGAIAFLALAQAAQAAPQTFPLTVTDGRMSGAGAQIIRAQLPSAQFILYGEDHGFADLPIILRALHARHGRWASDILWKKWDRFPRA